MAWYKRRDGNHKSIEKALSDAGRPLVDVSQCHGLGCDIMASHVDGRVVFLEVKLPKNKKPLPPTELKLQALFPRDFHVVTTEEEALAAVGVITLGVSAAERSFTTAVPSTKRRKKR